MDVMRKPAWVTHLAPFQKTGGRKGQTKKTPCKRAQVVNKGKTKQTHMQEY